MSEVPTFSSDDFTWKAGRGHSNTNRLDLVSFPRKGFFIRSTRTGKSQLFLPDDAVMVENEFFDGEAAAYYSPAGDVKVQIWTGE